MEPSSPARPSVWVIGEALIDVVRDGDTVDRHPGGSPLNVAVGLARLGEPTVLSTSIGTDVDGDAIVGHVESSGARLGEGSRTASSTSTAEAVLDTNGSATYVFDIDWSWTPPAGAVRARIVHTGSLATFLHPGREGVATALDTLPKEVFRSYDPNIRPALLHSRADALDAFQRFSRRAQLVKLSDDDLRWISPGASPPSGIAEIRSLGPAVVAVTRGGSGVTLGSVHGTIDVPAVPATVIDTVGAGDSWTSGFLHGLAEFAPDVDICDPALYTLERMQELARFAAECAAVTVSRRGAKPPYLSELERP